MKVVNNSEEFKLMFNGKEYTIPKGEFEVINKDLVNHLLARSKFWKKDVKVIEESQPETIKKIDIQPLAESVVKKVTPVFSGASMDTLPKKQVETPTEQTVIQEQPAINILPRKKGRPRKNALPQVA